MWTRLISRDDTLNGCFTTTIQLTGTYTLGEDLDRVKAWNSWTEGNISSIKDYTDGYKARMEITMGET
jgi:hypothetical protein